MGKVTGLDEIKRSRSLIINEEGDISNLEIVGNRQAQAVSYPELLAAVVRIEAALNKINTQLADITGEEDPL